MSRPVYLLGRTKPRLVLVDRHGFEQGIVTPVCYLIREGRAGESPGELAAAGRYAFAALHADRRLKKKKYGVVVLSVVLGGEVRVTPIYVRHAHCPRSTFSATTLGAAWEQLFALPGLCDNVVRYYETEGEDEHRADDSAEAGTGVSDLRARGGAAFGAPAFAAAVEVTIPAEKK